MKAFVLAAGLGTRLRPWTLEHPKALVPVCGVPMLQRVVERLRAEGFDEIVVNVHHFAGQIQDFLASRDFGVRIEVSDESDLLLDTGGGLLHAARLLGADDKPFLVHNVDILSDAPLAAIMEAHRLSGNDVSLVTSGRESSRKLAFDAAGELRGWHNLATGELRPASYVPSPGIHEAAFSGVYVVNPSVFGSLREYAGRSGGENGEKCTGANPVFPIMDFFLDNASRAAGGKQALRIGEINLPKLHLIDIGKPDTLAKAEDFLGQLGL